MEAEDPLSQLADIHLPDAVSAWPPAPGWWVLAALVLLGLVLLGRRQLQRAMLRRRLQAALGELERAYRAWQTLSQSEGMRNQAGLDLLHGFNAVLKRVALVHYPALDVARLTGRQWLEFLDRSGRTTGFTGGAGQVLADGIYRPVFAADVDSLHALCRDWVTRTYLEPLQPEPGAASADDAKLNQAGGEMRA